MKNLTKQIEKRAYELFLAGGQKHGNSTNDWLQAEKEIKAAAKNPATKATTRPAPKKPKAPAKSKVAKKAVRKKNK